MRIAKVVALILTIVIGLMVSGCATKVITGSADVDKNSFGAKKKFAVVSIASLKTFQGEQGLMQLFKSNDNIPGVNTQPIINKLRPRIIGALGKSKHFTLMPENAVFSNKAYKSLEEDEKVVKVLFMSEAINVADSYKYVSAENEKKYAKLASDLGVDGVIGITVSFSVSSGGGALNAVGLSLGRKNYSAMASVSAVAYNKNGAVIWKDSTVKEADPGDKKAIILVDTTGVTDTNFEKLHPSAVEIGEKAMGVLLARLDDTMTGKEASKIQSVK